MISAKKLTFILLNNPKELYKFRRLKAELIKVLFPFQQTPITNFLPVS